MLSKTSDIAISSGKKMDMGAHYIQSHSLRVRFNIRKKCDPGIEEKESQYHHHAEKSKRNWAYRQCETK